MAWEDEMVGSDVATAGLYISQCIGKDVTGQLDLEEALEASRYSSHPYSSHPKEWPPLAEIAETHELPPALIERYNASGGEGTALCGIFPEIRRVWASVDNSLFLWRFDKWDGQCPEYSGEEQAICAVGLAKTKPGIFIEAIQYLLVLVTPADICLVGLCCSGSGDGIDPYAEISLQPLPDYTIPSDGVTMTCVACTEQGNIFLAGRDGNIYEIQYSTGSSWRKHCRKVCLTTGLGSLVSRWVLPNAFKFGTVDPIIDMVVDNERHAIYARTEGMKLQVFDLGADGNGPFKKIAEEKNLTDPRETQYGSNRRASRSVNRAVRPSIVCIAPLSILESKWLHMVAVLSDGRRLYLTTSSTGSNSNGSTSNTLQRPSCLKIISTRPSPPLGVHGGFTFGAISAAGRSQPEDLALKIESAYYSLGTFLISDSPSSTAASLLIVNRDSSSMQSSSLSSNYGLNSRSTRALRELVSSLPIEGRMLAVADVLPSPDTAFTVQSLYADVESFAGLGETCEKACAKLWARGDLPTQHILPKRRIVIFSTMGLLEVVFNRPVDILKRLFECNAPRPQIEEFFNRFGAGESASMCLMLAAKLVFDEGMTVTNSTAEKAAEAFEDPGFVGMPQLNGSSTALTNSRAAAGSFSMGQVVQEAEPVFSGAHEGLRLCSSRLLFPIWDLPVFVSRGGVSSDAPFGVVAIRLSVRAVQILETKIRSLETFLRSRRNKRRGLYGYVAGKGDFSGSILYGAVTDGPGRNFFPNQGNTIGSVKRQRLLQTPAELAAMEVRAMECLRRLLRRSSEALFLLQLISNHHVTRLIQGLDNNVCQRLVHLTFNQFVCSEEGDQLAMQLISRLMEYYIGPDGRGTVDEISAKLREGCPSYYNESDYEYFLAVECLERASLSVRADEREKLAREALNHLTKFPESADLKAVCRRFENLRFYEAVVRLPLQKAQALDPKSDASNDKADPGLRGAARAQREQCYEIIMDAIRSLKSTGSNRDPSSCNKYVRQIIQLSVQWPDPDFHEYLYKTLIDLNLEDELLEYGGSDLVPFLQNAGRKSAHEVLAISSATPVTSPMGTREATIRSSQTKYLHLLAKYYVTKRQHILAANILYRLAEMPCADIKEAPTLEQRRQYLSNAVLQAKSAHHSGGSPIDSAMNNVDDQLLDVLEAKLAVLRFQMRIKEDLELIASKLDIAQSIDESYANDQFTQHDVEVAKAAKDKAKELALNLKSVTQLYNEYAVPFQLWEVCLEMLSFASHSGDADSRIVRETWARLLDKALSTGGIAEACAVLKRVGSNLYPGDGACLPLDTLCLHLEKAAMERVSSGAEIIGDEDIARSLLAACKGAHEHVLSIYDQLLSNGAFLPSPNLRLRLLRSVLVILREWTSSVCANKMGMSMVGSSYLYGGSISREQTTIANQGMRDKIASAANRYMTEIKRLPLPQSQTEPVYRGFREIEEQLMAATSFRAF